MTAFSLRLAALAPIFLAVPCVFSADSPELTRLQGIWSGKRTTDNGAELTQTVEISGDKLTYTLADAGKEVRLFAKGTVKAEKLGPFHVMKLTELQAGRSAADTQPVEDERTTIYVLSDDTLTLASNFDKERENQKPSLDQYRRTERPKAAAGSAEKLAGKWKMNVKLADNDIDYDLSFTRAGSEGVWAATLTSPRSGDHKFKSVTFADGKLSMELVRDIQGNEATLVYTGEFKDETLSGTFVVKGLDEQYKGTWTARR
jgi:hypothetical protein